MGDEENGEHSPVRVGGFHSEWLSIGRHRVLIEKRHGFPDERLRFHARLAVEVCDAWGVGADFGDPELVIADTQRPYVISVFCDDGRAATTTITVGGLNGSVISGIDQRIREIFEAIYFGVRFECKLVAIRGGEVGNRDYNVMEHLSVEAGVAVDRDFPRATDAAPW